MGICGAIAYEGRTQPRSANPTQIGEPNPDRRTQPRSANPLGAVHRKGGIIAPERTS